MKKPRVFCISCNYFEGRTGNLKKTLDQLKKNKDKVDPNIFYIGMFDNGSTDNSAEIINSFVEDGTVDVFIQCKQNVGKSKALNTVYSLFKEQMSIEPNDLILHLDSDIQLCDDFIPNLLEFYDFVHDDANIIFSRFTSNEDAAFLFDLNSQETLEFNGKKAYKTKNPQIIGCCMAVPSKIHDQVGGYAEIQGKFGLPLYGADDGIFILKAAATNPDGFFYIYDGLQAFHPETLDEAYKERKKDDIRKFQSLFSTFGIVDTLPGDIKPGTGMYDEK